ncbi:restriction endonuclease subunit S [Liquorilactobacillus hordei]|uniref:restriction endonuclease subunit S n=1 Tax=Liquorilactobacillus hordei TaxID=468911 RepID=UPI001CBB6B39|nr:restriction endonuclease subunit S [Liquorilactobacillus hordei]MBZ2406445.1 restriction endonuclease subunit S [Liquorilactobacillus hordei]
MEIRKLSEFVTFVQGINQSRAEKQFGNKEIDYYDQASFEEDHKYYNEAVQDERVNYLFDQEVSLDKRDVVISNSLQRATMIGDQNVGKVLSLNFTKVEFKDDLLDKRYFLYLFNSHKDTQRQKNRGLQGTGPVLRLTKQALEQLSIPLVPIEEQREIGKIYIESLKLQSKLSTYIQLLEQFTSSMLEKNLKK